MIGGGGRIFLIVFCLFLFLAAACTVKQIPRTGGEVSDGRDRLRTLTQDPSPRAQAHLEKAKLYTSHRNFQRNYSKACREFEAYLALVPAELQKEEELNWLAVLKELERAENEIADLKGAVKSLRAESDAGGQAVEVEVKKNKEMRAAMEKTLARVDTLEKANRTLHEANRSMRESNEKMKDIIDQLVQLDQELEQKRRSIK